MTITPDVTPASEELNWIPADTFGSRLALVRHGLELSQLEAAEACGLSAPTWSTWERGASPRNMAAVVDAIHRGLHVDRDWLMWGQNWKYFNGLTPLPTNDSPEPTQPTLPGMPRHRGSLQLVR